MIKTADLPTGTTYGGGRWAIDQRSGALVNASTGRSFAVGDRVTVMIAAIDLPLRKMDLIIADPRSRDVGKSKRLPDKAASGGAGAGKHNSPHGKHVAAKPGGVPED